MKVNACSLHVLEHGVRFFNKLIVILYKLLTLPRIINTDIQCSPPITDSKRRLTRMTILMHPHTGDIPSGYIFAKTSRDCPCGAIFSTIGRRQSNNFFRLLFAFRSSKRAFAASISLYKSARVALWNKRYSSGLFSSLRCSWSLWSSHLWDRLMNCSDRLQKFISTMSLETGCLTLALRCRYI